MDISIFIREVGLKSVWTKKSWQFSSVIRNSTSEPTAFQRVLSTAMLARTAVKAPSCFTKGWVRDMMQLQVFLLSTEHNGSLLAEPVTVGDSHLPDDKKARTSFLLSQTNRWGCWWSMFVEKILKMFIRNLCEIPAARCPFSPSIDPSVGAGG